MCLVINKMDRLIHEVKMSPEEAYTRVRGIITHVNMILSAFQSEQHISEADAVIAHKDAKATADSRCKVFTFPLTQNFHQSCWYCHKASAAHPCICGRCMLALGLAS